MHDQKAGGGALEVHLTVGKAMRRAMGNGHVLFAATVEPRRIKRRPPSALGAGDVHQAFVGKGVGLIGMARGQGLEHRGGNALFSGDGRLQLGAPGLVQLRNRAIDRRQHRRGTLRVIHRPVRRHLDLDALMLQRGMQVHLLMAGAQTHAAKDQLRIHRRLKGHGALEEGRVALEHGEIVAAPRDELRIIAAPGDKFGKDVGKFAAGAELFFGHAGDFLNMLIQPLIQPRADHLRKGIHDTKIPVDAAGADLDDLMRHAVVRVIAGLVPFQIKDNQMAARAAGKRKHGSHPVHDSYC